MVADIDFEAIAESDEDSDEDVSLPRASLKVFQDSVSKALLIPTATFIPEDGWCLF